MKILITGAEGQVGQALQDALSSHTIFPRSKSDVDITHQGMIANELDGSKPDLVINTAAYNNVDGAESDSFSANAVNADGPLFLAIETNRRHIPLVHFSTDYVFDGRSSKPYIETDSPNPLSSYGKSKLRGEQAVRDENPSHYLIRTAWVYSHVGKNFAKTILSLSSKPTVRVVNDQFGSPTYAPHLAQSVRLLIENKMPFGLYHMAGSGRASWFDLTTLLYTEMGLKTPVEQISSSEFPRPAPRPAFAVLDSIKDFKLKLPPWEHGVREFVKQSL